MKTFTEMAEEWIRANVSTTETPARVRSAAQVAAAAIPDTPEPDEFDPLDDLRQPFVDWFDSRIWVDAEAVALCRPNPRWCAGMTSLHGDFCSWMIQKDQVPPTLVEFRHLLEELCCAICDIRGELFVMGISLRDDVEAQKSFEDPSADD